MNCYFKPLPIAIAVFLFFSTFEAVKLSAEEQSVTPEEINTDSIDGVIVPQASGRNFYYNNRIKGYFTPSQEDILKAESKLIDYIQETTSPGLDYPLIPDLSQKLANYKRQYVGIILEDGNKIWLNFFCDPHNDGWKYGVISVIGGGGCYFNVLYDIKSEEFSHLLINGLPQGISSRRR